MQWVKVTDRLPNYHDILKVRRKNGDEIECFYHSDVMAWLKFYGVKTSHFQERHAPNRFLFDVTHWLDRKN